MEEAYHVIHKPTCFGKRLIRSGDAWRWIDGVIEPRVRDVPSWQADLTSRVGTRSTRVVEIPSRLADFYDPLGWVRRAAMRGDYDIDFSSGSYPALPGPIGSSAQCPPGERRSAGSTTAVMVILVPLAHWVRWCQGCPILPVWSADDEWPLEQEACTHGWLPSDARVR